MLNHGQPITTNSRPSGQHPYFHRHTHKKLVQSLMVFTIMAMGIISGMQLIQVNQDIRRQAYEASTPLPTPTPSQLTTDNGLLRGKVVDTDTHSPLTPAIISLYTPGTTNSSPIATTSTDASGAYSLYAPDGSYDMLVTSAHYTTLRVSIMVRNGQTVTKDINLTRQQGWF